MTFMKTLSLSVAAFFTLMGAAANPPALSDVNQFSFVNMQNDTTISISYRSSGCFHYESGVLSFTPETLTYQGETKTVNFQDMAGLDKYFTALSSKQGQLGGCTSSTHMTLTLNRDGENVGQISLMDDFCFRGDGMIAPDSLKYKLFEKEKADQQTLIRD